MERDDLVLPAFLVCSLVFNIYLVVQIKKAKSDSSNLEQRNDS
jgi:hypothetical protein